MGLRSITYPPNKSYIFTNTRANLRLTSIVKNERNNCNLRPSNVLHRHDLRSYYSNLTLMLKSIIATVAGLAIASPASASSWADINELQNLVTGTGTKIQKLDCPAGKMGFYQFDKANKIDRLVYCKNNVDMTDPDAVWEVLVHEVTHVIQTCYGGPVMKDTYVPRVLRELQETAPHYYAVLQEYRGDHKRVELEAFWMELRTPQVAADWMLTYCYQQ